MADILPRWLVDFGFGGFILGMCVFFGSYTLLVGRLGDAFIGRRRALALFCLALGLGIGRLAGMAGEGLPQKPSSAVDTVGAVSPDDLTAVLLRILLSVGMCVLVLGLGAWRYKPVTTGQRVMLIGTAAILGFLSFWATTYITPLAWLSLLLLTVLMVYLLRRYVSP